MSRLPMRSLSVLALILTVLLGCSLAQKNSSSVRISAVMSLSLPLFPGTFNQIFQSYYTVMPEMISVINNDTSLLRNTTLNLSITDSRNLQPAMLGGMLRESRTGSTAAIGGVFDLEAIALATSSTVLKFPVLIHYSGFPALSNRELYPFTCRMVPSSVNQIGVIFDIFDHFYGITKQIQWKQPAVVSGANPYGVALGAEFVKKAEARGFYVPTYQQFLAATNTISAEIRDLTPQVTGLKDSKARVFVALLLTLDMQNFIINAKKYGLFNPKNVWLCSDACAQNFIQYNITTFPNQTVFVEDTLNSIQGMLGVTIPLDVKSTKFQFITETYQRITNVSFFTSTPPMFDAFYTLGYALDHLIKQNLPPIPTNVLAAIRNVSFAGATGWVDFDSNCERRAVYDIVNVWRGLKCPECLGLHPTDFFIPVGRWNHSSGLNMYRPVHFFDGTTKIPDLNLHHPFDYFDCKDGRKKTDETGKTIDLEKPKWGAGNIDADYYCDEYLDCDDMSDEPYDCVPSFKILFIIYGIITGLLILFTILVFVPFTILFGFIIPRRRVRASSPLFLLIIIVSGVFGYGSTYAWYGKPQSVACGFQPWLLGLAIVSMNSALIAKTFRIWRVFRSPFKVKVISNVELIVLWIILVAPVLLILFLWTLVSTPTAKLEEHDGLEHLVCGPGGFTDSIVAGYVWFFLLVGYQGLVMLVGIFLTFAIRNVPSKFNEGKLIAISIYNITLLGVIVIPVFLILRYTIPFVAWIIRTSVIIYVFTATLWLQFLPKIGGVFISDKLKEPAMQDTTNSPNTSTRYDTNAI